MKVTKKINNNFALAIDEENNEVIVYGKGVGFHAMPYLITDLKLIDRTYYDIDLKYVGLLNEIPEEIIVVTTKIVDRCRAYLKSELNPNLVFTLADHIHFAIHRQTKNISFDYLLYFDINQMYAEESAIARWSMQLIETILGVKLPEDEVGGITMSIVNSKLGSVSKRETQDNKFIIESITNIIEKRFDINVDRNSANFSRFATHIQYLLKRLIDHRRILSDNLKLFQETKIEFPKIYDCAIEIGEFIEKSVKCEIDEEELLYLMLHINKLYTSEDCNRKGITPRKQL